MSQPIIKKIYLEYKETKKYTLPDELLPVETGYRLLPWLEALFTYYREESIIVRPFDELPPLKLSQRPELATTIQDVHRFIISDLNLVPLETRKALAGHAVSCPSSHAAWQTVKPLLMSQLETLDDETVRAEITWKFSPVAEILWMLTWVFMERERVVPPQATFMTSTRFPYYLWLNEENKQSLWEPENPLCRWEWLALDLYQELRNT